MVNAAYVQLVTDVFGAEVMSQFGRDYKADQLEFLRDFEMKKREVTIFIKDSIKFQFPVALAELACDIFMKRKLSDKIEIIRDGLFINADLIRSLFDKTVTNIVQHVHVLLAKPEVKSISTILLVGGFAESTLVKDAIRREFPQKQVINPPDAGLAVLKGAVIYGHRPEVIRARVVRHTYGVRVSKLFDASRHPVENKYIEDGKECCRDVFERLVHQGQSVCTGVTVTYRGVLAADRTTFRVHLYASTSRSPQYVTDPGCTRLGAVEIDMSATKGRRRNITAHFSFGDTEISATVVEDETVKSWKGSVSFLG
jgi:hypothetical protein